MPYASATYARRVALGLCPACGTREPFPSRAWCEPCLEAQTVRQHLFSQQPAGINRRMATRRGFGPAPAPVTYEMAHCGQWHAIDAVPWHCPMCGTALLESAP